VDTSQAEWSGRRPSGGGRYRFDEEEVDTVIRADEFRLRAEEQETQQRDRRLAPASRGESSGARER
jgi:hypothetical protein